jgi:hypothetical protein
VTHHIEAVWVIANVWERWALVALFVAGLGQAAFVATYMRRPWWRHLVGRALMVKSTSLLLILWLSLANTFITYPGQEQVAVGVLTLTALAIWYQLFAIRSTPPYIGDDHR